MQPINKTVNTEIYDIKNQYIKLESISREVNALRRLKTSKLERYKICPQGALDCKNTQVERCALPYIIKIRIRGGA